MQIPVCRNLFLAGACRAIFSSVTVAFLPVYFQRNFPNFKSQFAVMNAASLIGCGFLANIIGSIITTKLEKKTHMAKSLVIVLGSLIGFPFFALTCFAKNFQVAIFSNIFQLLFMSYYLAPSVTMMQKATGPQNAGLVLSTETFFAYVVGTIFPLLFGFLANRMGAMSNPRIYGRIVFFAFVLGSTLSNIFYYRAGRCYKQLMESREKAGDSGQPLVQGQ